MANNGALIGNTYALPQAQAPVIPQQTQFDDGVHAMEGLQYVKGQTEDYYNKVSALKSFMQDMHANYGIDVRVPDLSRPESVKLNQIYNDAIADILNQGNLLKTSNALHTMRDQRGVVYKPGFDPNSIAAGELQSGRDFWERPLEQQVTQTNDLTQRPTYDKKAEAAAQKIYDDKIKEYDEIVKKHPELKDWADYQKRGLTPPVEHIKQFAPQRDTSYDRRTGRLVRTSGNFLKDIVQLQKGTSDSYKLDENVLNPETNRPLLVSYSYQDANRGSDPSTGRTKEIKYWGHDPSTGQTFIFYKDGSHQEVTKENSLSLTRGLLGDNSSRFGVGAEYVDAYADDNNLYNTDGSINMNHPMLSRDNEQKIIGDRFNEQEKSMVGVKQAHVLKQLEDLDKNNTSPWIGSNPSITLDLPNGNQAIVKRMVGGGLYIPNIRDLVAKPTDKNKVSAYNRTMAALESGKDSDGNKLTTEKINQMLIKLKAYKAVELKPQSKKDTTGTQVAPTQDNDPLRIR